jgi:hypothetical protein
MNTSPIHSPIPSRDLLSALTTRLHILSSAHPRTPAIQAKIDQVTNQIIVELNHNYDEVAQKCSTPWVTIFVAALCFVLTILMIRTLTL